MVLVELQVTTVKACDSPLSSKYSTYDTEYVQEELLVKHRSYGIDLYTWNKLVSLIRFK